MEASDAWKERWEASTLPMAKTFMEVACRKKSLVCLAADKYTMVELFDLLEAVGPSIAALKTHVDLIDDWNKEDWGRFCNSPENWIFLFLKIENLQILGKFPESRWVAFTTFRNGAISLLLT